MKKYIGHRRKKLKRKIVSEQEKISRVALLSLFLTVVGEAGAERILAGPSAPPKPARRYGSADNSRYST